MSILVQESVRRTLFRMAFPMLAGTFAMNAYSLTDAWFISRLGTPALAAVGFIFPVTMLLTLLAAGIGTGVTALMSHALGRHDHAGAAKLTTQGLALTCVVTALISAAGWLWIAPVFRWLGADAAIMPLISGYMSIWYLGALTMALPMLGNGILISAGDSRGASFLMIFGTLLNAVLNPLFIFGCLGLPEMGIRGSALATVIAQASSTLMLFVRLRRRHRLLALERWPLRDWLGAFGRILGFAIPSTLSMALMPLSAAALTWILSRFGNEAVAASGAAGRIEMFAFVIPMALGISLNPFVSQNYGAGRLDRIREARTLAGGFAVLYGGAVAVAFFLAAPWLAAAFSDDSAVTVVLTSYIRIICFGYGMMEVHRYCSMILTGLHRPASSMALNLVRVAGLLVPLSLLGAHFWGVTGVFVGRLAADLTSGGIGLAWVARALRAEARAAADAGPAGDGRPRMDF
ncbi:MAG TPA: MATE family efflux transporter [Planctomycetota bacterium]|nr:MATE family efflux transporter [Planctomycetota bacterium]